MTDAAAWRWRDVASNNALAASPKNRSWMSGHDAYEPKGQ
jgi:hypothetical protein